MIDLRKLARFIQQRRHNPALRALSNQQQEFLVHIAASPEPPLVGDLAVALKIKPTNASQILKDLLARGMVSVAEDLHDRRAKRVSLLPAGRAICERLELEYRGED